MSVNVQCDTPVNLSPRKRQGAKNSEGLVRTMPSLMLLIDCCIHHERRNEMDSAPVDK